MTNKSFQINLKISKIRYFYRIFIFYNQIMEENNKLLPKKEDKNLVDKGKNLKPEPINYKFLDGLRGFGAFAVFIYHSHKWFPENKPGANPIEKYEDKLEWILYFKSTPFTVFVKGPFWVYVFFIISGFVLPLSWFKIRNDSSIYGGTFRRYFRLMIPCWVIISIYYFVCKLNLPNL